MDNLLPMILNYVFIFTDETPVTVGRALDVSEQLVRQWCANLTRRSSIVYPNKSAIIHFILYINKHYPDKLDVKRALSYLNPKSKINGDDLEKLKLLFDDVSKFNKRYCLNNKKLILESSEKYKLDCETNINLYRVIDSIM